MSDFEYFLNKRLKEEITGDGNYGRIAEFCELTKIPRRTVTNWLAMKTPIPVSAFPAIADWMECEIWELLVPPGFDRMVDDQKTRESLIASIVLILPNLDEEQLRTTLTHAKLAAFNVCTPGIKLEKPRSQD